MLAFYLTRLGRADDAPLVASSDPELVAVVLTTLLDYFDRLRLEGGNPEEAERFRRLLASLDAEEVDGDEHTD